MGMRSSAYAEGQASDIDDSEYFDWIAWKTGVQRIAST